MRVRDRIYCPSQKMEIMFHVFWVLPPCIFRNFSKFQSVYRRKAQNVFQSQGTSLGLARLENFQGPEPIKSDKTWNLYKSEGLNLGRKLYTTTRTLLRSSKSQHLCTGGEPQNFSSPIAHIQGKDISYIFLSYFSHISSYFLLISSYFLHIS